MLALNHLSVRSSPRFFALVDLRAYRFLFGHLDCRWLLPRYSLVSGRCPLSFDRCCSSSLWNALRSAFPFSTPVDEPLPCDLTTFIILFLLSSFFIYVSWTGDYHAYNLCNPNAFPGLSRKERANLFSRVVYYPPSDKRNRGAHMPLTRAEPLVSGKRGVGRVGDAGYCRIPGTRCLEGGKDM